MREDSTASHMPDLSERTLAAFGDTLHNLGFELIRRSDAWHKGLWKE